VVRAPEMSATSERDSVRSIAARDPGQALERARSIRDPWYRCQALAHVARHGPLALVEKTAREAVVAAHEHPDPYKVVGASAWPVRALIERARPGGVPRLLQELLAVGRTIEHPVSRLEALFLLWEAAFPFDAPATEAVFGAFRSACSAASSWKAGDRLELALLTLATRDRSRAMEVAKAMPDGKYKVRAIRKLDAGERREPRGFF